jgi:hypothetical protein
MPKWIFAVLLGVMLVWSAPVSAQSALSLAKLEVDLWPEYDRPEVLVVYHMFLDSGVTLPANLVVSIPSASGEPAAVAVRNPDGQLYNVAYTRVVNGQVAQISFSAPVTEIQFEYYDPGLSKVGANHSFTYNWTGEYSVKSFTVQVQQPSGASSMKITPTLGNGIPGEGGLMYFSSDLGALKSQQQLTVSLSYQKSNDNLSVQTGKVGPAAPVDAATPGRASFGTVWIYVIGAGALLMVIGSGFWYWRSDRKAPVRERRHPMAYREKPTQPSAVDTFYCHQCGKRASGGDVFCRSCGTRLRRD